MKNSRAAGVQPLVFFCARARLPPRNVYCLVSKPTLQQVSCETPANCTDKAGMLRNLIFYSKLGYSKYFFRIFLKASKSACQVARISSSDNPAFICFLNLSVPASLSKKRFLLKNGSFPVFKIL